MAIHVRLSEVERGERPFGLLEVLHGRVHVTEEVVGDAQFEVDLLLLGGGGDREPLVEDVEDFAEVADLGAALGEPFAELGDHAAFEVFTLDEQRRSIIGSVTG